MVEVTPGRNTVYKVINSNLWKEDPRTISGKGKNGEVPFFRRGMSVGVVRIFIFRGLECRSIGPVVGLGE